MSNLSDILLSRLQAFDGKAITLLSETRAAHGAKPGYIEALTHLAASPEDTVASGATWLLKAEIDAGGTLPDAALTRLAETLHPMPGWQAALHTCQIFARFAPPRIAAPTLADALEPLLTHPRPFLRAWSVAAYVRLGEAYSAHTAASKAALTQAADDPAASVRARARKLL